jgi:hypothetical protein
MARSPIILESNLIPGSYGALPPNQYYTSPSSPALEGAIENEDGTFTAKTYQLQSNKPTFDLDIMQNVYGTKYMPMFQWVSQKETGSVTFDPEEDMIDQEEYDRLRDEFNNEHGMTPEEAMKQEAITMGVQLAGGIGGQIGRSVASNIGDGQSFDLASLGEGISDFSSDFEIKNIFGPSEGTSSSKVRYSPDSSNQKYIDFEKNNPTSTLKQKQVAKENLNKGLEVDGTKPKVEGGAKVAPAVGNTGYLSGVGDRLSSFGKNSTAAGRANLYGSAGAGLGTAAAMLIGGASLKESAKAGAKVSAGMYIGTAIGGPIGGFIGSVLGGRVICNELQRQGIMTRKQVVLDYRFTRDYLTPTHVNGYHIWAVWMVKQMRKGRLVNFWTHVAGHRANEIAYIYGDRDKPDYLGKVYRKILEPICWSIGFFCKKTDWSVLYKQKEV